MQILGLARPVEIPAGLTFFMFIRISCVGLEHAYSVFASIGLWYNSHCEDADHFVCKRAVNASEVVTDPNTTPVDGYCPQGYIGIGQ